MTEDEEYPYYIRDVVEMTAAYALEQPDTVSNKAKAKLSSLLCTVGSAANSATESRTAQYITELQYAY